MSGPEIVVAELPGGAGRGQDRCRTADGLVVVLDGASAFDKQANPDASDYVDHLANALITTYVENPACDLVDGLAHAIEATVSELRFTPGTGPSSTVAVVRWGRDTVDSLVLGDSTVIVCTSGGCDVVTDDSLSAVAPAIRRRYRDRLAAGGGFNAEHSADLAELQRHQAALRNRHGGYWIAEGDPGAASHALVRSYSNRDVEWCVAATDGAQRPLDNLGREWNAIAALDADEGFDLLVDLHHWEGHIDPAGLVMPRSKRHDDKVLAIMRRSRTD